MNPFLLSQALNRYISFTDDHIVTLKKVAVIRSFKKKETILPFGEKEEYISCIANGLVRKHIMCGNKSVCTDFSPEGSVVCSNSSFGTNLPSEYCVEAIEASTLISFTLGSLNWLYNQSPVFFEFGKVMVGMSLFKSEEREIMLMKYDAPGRLAHFMDTKAELFLRLPQHYIASYLNIQPQTFSRLKHGLLYNSK